MINFKYSSLIDASVEEVWNFHERPDILEILSPPWPPLKVIRREGGLDVGAISEFCLLIGVFPVRWVARHTACEKYRLFIDEQDIGPMATWTHRHLFRACWINPKPKQGKHLGLFYSRKSARK